LDFFRLSEYNYSFIRATDINTDVDVDVDVDINIDDQDDGNSHVEAGRMAGGI
jgi:hypothetical protein